MSNLEPYDPRPRVWAHMRQLFLAEAARQRRTREEAAQRRLDDAERRRQQPWQEAEAALALLKRALAWKAQQNRDRWQTRVRRLQTRYDRPEWHWRNDPELCRQYARHHRADLVARRDAILARFEAFHDDPAFIKLLMTQHPDLYNRIDDVFEWRAVALAEQPDSTPTPPPRPKLTPDEWRARIERYRDRMLARERVKAEDLMAGMELRLQMIDRFRSMLGQYDDLDPDEVDRLTDDFREELFQDDQGDEAIEHR